MGRRQALHASDGAHALNLTAVAAWLEAPHLLDWQYANRCENGGSGVFHPGCAEIYRIRVGLAARLSVAAASQVWACHLAFLSQLHASLSQLQRASGTGERYRWLILQVPRSTEVGRRSVRFYVVAARNKV